MWMVSCSTESGWVVFPVPGKLLEVLPQGQQHPALAMCNGLAGAGLSAQRAPKFLCPCVHQADVSEKSWGSFDLEFMVYSLPLKEQNGNNRS